MMELAETGPVTCLSVITEVRFAYGLANGTIGIYEEGLRLWRVKVSEHNSFLVLYQRILYLHLYTTCL